MTLGIFESRQGKWVPGTTRYFDDPSRTQYTNGVETGEEKTTNTRTDPTSGLRNLKTDGSIILIPQPSDDPNDPLNWPLWRRDLITFALCFAAILATALGAILASNTLVILSWYRVDVAKTAVLTGYYLLGAGAAAIFFVPSGRIWGKRHLFLLGIVFVILSSIWAGASGEFKPDPTQYVPSQQQKSLYASLATARAVQGIGAAPFESLLNAAVGDLYCVHQRGVRMAFSNLAVFGGAFFTPVVVGKITHTIGWQWTFYLVAIFSAVVFPVVFLYCPETAYRRDDKLNIDLTIEEERLNPGGPGVGAALQSRYPEGERPKGMVLFPRSSSMQPIGDANTPKKTFAQSLSLFDGRKTYDRYWKLLLRPFPLLMNPTFIWACLVQGTMIGWTIFIGVIIAVIFIGPPYFWGEEKSGYAYVAPFLGAVVGFLVSGLMADSSAKFLTRRNNGIYEPEFRLILVIPMIIAAGVGLYGFGITADKLITGEYHYAVPLTFFAFEVAGMVIGTVASSLYVVDAYRNLTVEAFTLMIIFKNFFSFVLTWFAYDWVIGGGFSMVFTTVASIQMGICVLTIPLYVFGKRIRAFYYKYDVMRITGLQ